MAICVRVMCVMCYVWVWCLHGKATNEMKNKQNYYHHHRHHHHCEQKRWQFYQDFNVTESIKLKLLHVRAGVSEREREKFSKAYQLH